MTSERVTLVIGDREFSGWTSVEVFRSLEQSASSFTLEAPGQSPEALAAAGLRPGAECKILSGGDPLLTGYVDRVHLRHDARSWQVQVQGRSRTADLVDCAAIADPPEFRKRRLEQIAATLAEPYGVDVEVVLQVGDSIGAPFSRHRLDLGETVHESIERLARLRSVLVTDDAEGRLVLTRAGAESATTAIRLGDNVLAGEITVDVAGVFSEYRCKGQRDGNDDDNGLAIVQAFGSTTDPGVTRRRVMVLHAETKASSADCKRRAQWEAAARVGRSVKLRFDLAGWRQDAGGELWATNLLVAVDDERLGVRAPLLVSSVRYRQDAGGTVCRLEVVPPAAFESGDLGQRETRARAGVKGW